MLIRVTLAIVLILSLAKPAWVVEAVGHMLSSEEDVNVYQDVDDHARNAPDSVEQDLHLLAEYLGSTANTDLDKARAIFVWLTDNITYDAEAYNNKNYRKYTPKSVMRERTALCGGFSALYQELGEHMGLEIKVVRGYAKGFSYQEGKIFDRIDHSWNIIKIDGQWRIFDATWGQGFGRNVDGKYAPVKEFDDFWFNADPYEAIFSHFPEDTAYCFVEPTPSLSQYEEWKKVPKSYFKLGFSGRKTYEALLAGSLLPLPEVYDPETEVEVIEAPLCGKLEKDKTYEFAFRIPKGEAVAIIDAKKQWTDFRKDGKTFSLMYRPQSSGKLKVSVKHGASGSQYKRIMDYEVE